MNRVVYKSLILSTSVAALLTAGGCGRNIPNIDAKLLEQKQALLLLTTNSLPEGQQNQIAGIFKETAQKEGVAGKWIVVSKDLTEEIREELTEQDYDGLLVIGEELLEPVSHLADQLQGKRVLLLGSTEETVQTATYGEFPPNVGIKYDVVPDPSLDTVSRNYNWGKILPRSMEDLLKPEWKGGRLTYTQDEVQ